MLNTGAKYSPWEGDLNRLSTSFCHFLKVSLDGAKKRDEEECKASSHCVVAHPIAWDGADHPCLWFAPVKLIGENLALWHRLWHGRHSCAKDKQWRGGQELFENPRKILLLQFLSSYDEKSDFRRGPQDLRIYLDWLHRLVCDSLWMRPSSGGATTTT